MINLKKVWASRKQILEGVTNTLVKKQEIENIARKRMDICLTCPILDIKGDKCLMPGTAPCCGECGCKLAFKTRSLSSECPHPDGPRWEAILDQAEEDKLYADINYNPDKS